MPDFSDRILITWGILFVSTGTGVAPSSNASESCFKSGECGRSSWPFVIHNWEIPIAISSAWSVLSVSGASRFDALEAGCAAAENDPSIQSVGAGNRLNELGEVTLDALMFDGESMSVGAVGGLRRIPRAIGVARAVMEHTKHTLLVGDSATQFALDMGFTASNLTSSDGQKQWELWKENSCQPNFRKNVSPDPTKQCGPYTPALKVSNLPETREELNINEDNHDTIGMLAVDEAGKIAAGTSTNGVKFKIPGRVGDTPIPGSGAYVLSRIGGAVATGDGDIIMRFSPTFLAVELLAQAAQKKEILSPLQVCKEALSRITSVYDSFAGALIVVSFEGEGIIWSACCHKFSFFEFFFANREEGIQYRNLSCSDIGNAYTNDVK